jgi:hypothetical protein
MAQSGEGKPRVVIAVFEQQRTCPEHGVQPRGSLRSEGVESMRAQNASLGVPSCLEGTTLTHGLSHGHSGRYAQHGRR